jgi:hypothetical protein
MHEINHIVNLNGSFRASDSYITESREYNGKTLIFKIVPYL